MIGTNKLGENDHFFFGKGLFSLGREHGVQENNIRYKKVLGISI